MQLLLIRHALPLRSEPGQGSDPDLSEEGIEQAKRLPEALARFPITRLVSSPQVRSIQTAQPVADALGLTIEVDERLAEYDRDMAHYIPIEQIAAEFPEELARLAQGHLPSSVDENAFLARINAGIRDLTAVGDHEDTIAVFTHGGVIGEVFAQAGRSVERFAFLGADNGSISHLVLHGDNWIVRRFNDTAHLATPLG